jgi:uncharacterized protein with FMN-binding domain
LEQQSSERRAPVYIPASASEPAPLAHAPDSNDAVKETLNEAAKADVKGDIRKDGAPKPIEVSSLVAPQQLAALPNTQTSSVAAPPAEAPIAAPVSAPKAVETPVAAPVAAPVETAAAAPAAPAQNAPPKWNDGRYLGWGTSRHGDIQAAVVIEGGRIVSATIADCRTRYSCSVIDRLPPEVAQRQSPEIDYVSGATQSTNAFYYAVVEALTQAKAR